METREAQLVRVLKSHKLSDRNEKFFSASCKAVQDKCDEFLRGINPMSTQDMPVREFWTTTYLPFIQQHKKASTVRGYIQIWNQHLQTHFADRTLQEYRTHVGSQFLLSLTKTQSLRTLNHVRSLASGIFAHAINLGLLEQNPWHDVKILGKVSPAKPTKWYTLEEAENIISALVDHVECQLVMALACFLGLRPGEIAGLRWEDFDSDYVHIRRAVAAGVVGTTKTPESVASLPLIDRVRLFLNLWREKCGRPAEGWVFENERGKPANLKDMVSRTIRPSVEAAGLEWKSIYAGRRGAGTAIIGLTGGNYAAAQELLRHKHMTTTLQFYKKQTQQALPDGMKALEAALNQKALNAPQMVGSE
jgi:integrase